MDQSMVAKVSEAPVDAIIKRQAIIILGNPLNGFKYWGSFTSIDAARAYRDDYLFDEAEWWVAELETPARN